MDRNKCRWAICDACEGHGQVDNPAFSNGFTSSEWNDMDSDDRESYLGGRYDVPCKECRGSGKISVPIVALMSFAEKRVLAAERRDDRLRAEYDRECAAERRAGC